ncbi:hypothetical protein TNCV_2163951 [Trichonephila clavipes]|nr:hypothetical protein TNCV_2163951 [Trichonephila clavipes]
MESQFPIDSSSTKRRQDGCLDFTRLLIVYVSDEVEWDNGELLIDEVEKLPYLWNPRHPHFTKRLKKKKLISADRHEDEREVAGTGSFLHARSMHCEVQESPARNEKANCPLLE